MTSSIIFIIIFLWFLCFIDTQLKNKNNNTESLRNCAEKAQIGFQGKSPILGWSCGQKMAAPTKIKIMFIIYNNIEKNNV